MNVYIKSVLSIPIIGLIAMHAQSNKKETIPMSLSNNTLSDHATTLELLKKKVEAFTKERDWGKFHNAKNIAMNISIEAAELMEHFVWTPEAEVEADVEKKRLQIEDELADIMFSVLLFANRCSIDISSAFEKKLKKTAEKYPVDKTKGKRLKYNEY